MKAGHEGGAVAGDSQVAGTGEGEAGPGGGSVDSGDDGLLERADREHGGVVVRAQALRDVVGAFAKLGQVLADAEPAACAREDDRTDVVRTSILQRSHELFLRLPRQRVQHLRPVERDRQDLALAPRLDLCHRSRLLTVWTNRRHLGAFRRATRAPFLNTLTGGGGAGKNPGWVGCRASLARDVARVRVASLKRWQASASSTPSSTHSPAVRLPIATGSALTTRRSTRTRARSLPWPTGSPLRSRASASRGGCAAAAGWTGPEAPSSSPLTVSC